MDKVTKCPICGKPATGAPDNWRCSASKYHFWRWKVNAIRKAKRAWEKAQTPYQREIMGAFKSDAERARFLTAHAPTYPVGA